jgi:phage N-6-adenine-methyltransferase
MPQVADIQIDPEFRALIPPLSDDERMLLEENLLRDGCRDPLVLWNGTLLDGHNRYDICTKHGLFFETVEIALPNREAAEDWIDTNQLGRRNLTPDQASLLRGRRYNRLKKQGERTDLTSGQNVQKLPHTAERLAEQHGVTERTIRRDGDFAEAVETLKPHVPDIEQRVMSGDVPSKQAVVEAAKTPEKAEQILGKAHVAHNSGNNEWYTPPVFIAAARAAMGSITLDPASSPVANNTVGAEDFFTAEQDGLTQSWRGNVWMNPPYAQPLISQFAEAVSEKYDAKEIKRACVLVNNATETAWFQRMLESASAVCFLRGRVRFLDPDGNPSGAPLQGQAVLYLGENPFRFAKAFNEHGHVLVKPE